VIESSVRMNSHRLLPEFKSQKIPHFWKTSFKSPKHIVWIQSIETWIMEEWGLLVEQEMAASRPGGRCIIDKHQRSPEVCTTSHQHLLCYWERSRVINQYPLRFLDFCNVIVHCSVTRDAGAQLEQAARDTKVTLSKKSNSGDVTRCSTVNTTPVIWLAQIVAQPATLHTTSWTAWVVSESD